MADPTWGMLQKSATDSETIEQAIIRLIASHEADSSAHLGVGESLEAHKTADVIDHPAMSVVDDKIRIDKFSIQSWFESLDGYNKSGSTFNYLGYMEMTTTTVLNSVVSMFAPADDQMNLTCDITKNPIWEFVGSGKSGNNFEARFGMGEMGTDNGIGFKLTKTTIHCVWFDNNPIEHLISVAGFDSRQVHKYRVEVLSGVSIKWYIDNGIVAELDISAITLQQSLGYMFSFGAKNLSSGQTGGVLGYRVLYQQDL